MYRIVFLDIDGTILDSKEELSLELVQTVKKLQQKGILVGLATGRSYDGAKKYGEQLGTSIFVTYNGGFSLINGEIIHDGKIPASLAYQLCVTAEELGSAYIHFSYRESRSNRPPKGIEYLLPEAKLSDLNDTNRDAHRLVLYVNQEQRAILQETAKDAAAPFDEGDRLEVFPKGSKWTGILPVITHLGISPEEVVTIGNGVNDIGMLEAAGLGIAMGNAPDCVKEKANYVTQDNDHAGVIVALNKVFSTQLQTISMV